MQEENLILTEEEIKELDINFDEEEMPKVEIEKKEKIKEEIKPQLVEVKLSDIFKNFEKLNKNNIVQKFYMILLAVFGISIVGFIYSLVDLKIYLSFKVANSGYSFSNLEKVAIIMQKFSFVQIIYLVTLNTLLCITLITLFINIKHIISNQIYRITRLDNLLSLLIITFCWILHYFKNISLLYISTSNTRSYRMLEEVLTKNFKIISSYDSKFITLIYCFILILIFINICTLFLKVFRKKEFQIKF